MKTYIIEFMSSANYSLFTYIQADSEEEAKETFNKIYNFQFEIICINEEKTKT